jgi:hypothetical protein
MKKLSIYLLLCSSFAAKAQWTGPSSGILSTSNNVLISNTPLFGTQGSPPPPGLFEIRSLSTPNVTVFSATHDNVTIGKPFSLNNSSLNMRRANGNLSLQVMPLGNLTLNTDGFTTANRGFFINSDGRNFFKVTEKEITFRDANQDLFKVGDNGFLYTRKVVVTLSNPFPDYVFSNTYKLKPLQEVEAFIKKNKHLPNLPSAQQISDNNNQLELGEMQLKLLEKIEELTLYVIQQQKEIEALKQQLTTH